MNANKETMLRRLQAADFVLHETVLYLDGHPTNQKALEFFRKAKTAYDELLAEFQQAFGPQTAYAADGSSPWEWVQGAWPWQSYVHVSEEAAIPCAHKKCEPGTCQGHNKPIRRAGRRAGRFAALSFAALRDAVQRSRRHPHRHW